MKISPSARDSASIYFAITYYKAPEPLTGDRLLFDEALEEAITANQNSRWGSSLV